MDFNPHLPKISNVLNKHFKSMIFKNQNLKEAFPDPPMAALRQPPNLRRILCRSYLYSVKRGDKFERSSKESAPGWHKCGKNCCICPFTSKNTTKVTAHITGYTHEIRQAVNCETANCIYYWKCIKDNCNQFPQCEYIGLTTRSFKKRFSEHKGYIESEDNNLPSIFLATN